MTSYMTAIMATLQSQMGTAMERLMAGLQEQMAGAMSADGLQDVFQFNMTEDELAQFLSSMLNNETNSYDNNLRKLGYADEKKPSEIDIYPKDFESKQVVLDSLDSYTAAMRDTGQDDRVITYTDLVGTLMKNVTEIVDMVSYVLIAFVSISLVVSSIMIGVITYISVLERKKEIGILRAMGASKRDIGSVFNAETLIVGFVAGLMGIVTTLLLTIPANAIVRSKFDIDRIAILPPLPALGLIGISMALTFLAGLIPSSAASRKDPVEALRSE
jgi:ABC-type antimicrobial peptide transport system permease subunit